MRSGRAVGAALLLAVAVAGCTGGEAAPAAVEPLASGTPSASATPPSSATASRSPSSHASTAPTGATGSETPAAFVRRYLDAISRSLQKADAGELRALSDRGCGGCNNFIGAVEGSAAAGHRTVGGDFSLIFAEAPPIENGETIVELRYSRTAAQVVDEDGSTITALPADTPMDAQMRLRREGSSWIVLGFRATPQ